MNTDNTTACLPKTVKNNIGISGWFRRLMVITSILGLGSCNVLTLFNDKIHTAAFSTLKSLMSSVLADDAVAAITRRSSMIRRQSDVAMATKNLMEEKAGLLARNKSLDLRYAELQKVNREVVDKHEELKRVSQLKASSVKKVSSRLAVRSARSASRNVSASAAEAIPWIGAAIVVAEVGWDVYDACETMKDANELNSIFGNEPEDQSKVCGMKVPTKDELLATVKTDWQSTYKTAAEVLNSAGHGVVSITPPRVSWSDLKGSVCSVLGSVPMICS